MIFLDSNIPMYAAGRYHSHKAPSVRLLQRVEQGEIVACTSTEVLQEILYRYLALKKPSLAFGIYDLFVQVCPNVFSITLADTDRAKAILQAVKGISPRDAIHAAVMLNHDVNEIATFDAGFDRIPSIERLSPRL